ncbi:MAG: hypothetical protein A2096_15815 [Spirochaetes bacterium GWF1_41_5]|nr:MAG: hypothetical protein A2096_15815 [Spirochaetes bacterium GWF1_41_5]HBE00891.1 hypothetical protein [Spirochaetia bacterium]
MQTERRRNIRLNIPDGFHAVLRVYTNEKELVFDAHIKDLSLTGLGIHENNNLPVFLLLSALQAQSPIIFHNAVIDLDGEELKTGIVWKWNRKTGRAGMEIIGLNDHDMAILKKKLDDINNYAKP